MGRGDKWTGNWLFMSHSLTLLSQTEKLYSRCKSKGNTYLNLKRNRFFYHVPNPEGAALTSSSTGGPHQPYNTAVDMMERPGLKMLVLTRPQLHGFLLAVPCVSRHTTLDMHRTRASTAILKVESTGTSVVEMCS